MKLKMVSAQISFDTLVLNSDLAEIKLFTICRLQYVQINPSIIY